MRLPRLLLASLCLAVASSVPAATEPATDASAATEPATDASAATEPATDASAALQTWADAFNRRDLDGIVSLYAADAVFWGTTSPILRDTPDKVRDYFSNMPQRPNVRVALGEHRLRVFGDLAVDTGAYTFSNTVDGQKSSTPARFTFVFQRRDGHWLIVDHHSSAAPPPRK